MLCPTMLTNVDHRWPSWNIMADHWLSLGRRIRLCSLWRQDGGRRMRRPYTIGGRWPSLTIIDPVGALHSHESCPYAIVMSECSALNADTMLTNVGHRGYH